MKHIELFAGCGGLALGLEKSGFELLFANELSPMASETFAFNLLQEDLQSILLDTAKPSKTLWISSRYGNLSDRLKKENPMDSPSLGDGYSDLPKKIQDVEGKLLVGNLTHLNAWISEKKSRLMSLQNGFGSGEIELVSGGPPCQSFSLAGLRKKDCEKNTLPWDFANFVSLAKPKFAVLENVSGILRAFKSDGESYYAWFEVAKAFAMKGYVPLCLHVNARLVGVPQNRPRFIMISIRHDVYLQLKPKLSKLERNLFIKSEEFYEILNSDCTAEIDDLSYFDAARDLDKHLFKDTFLNHFYGKSEVSVKEAIDDLRIHSSKPKSKYVKTLNSKFKASNKRLSELKNHQPRNNGPHVQRRFRIYQVIEECSPESRRDVLRLLSERVNTIKEETWTELKLHKFLKLSNEFDFFKNKASLVMFLKRHITKKQTQRALREDLPASAALSIPDDVCHYSPDELRTLTVREMARIQSFPDDFEFRSKITTGGSLRKFEVPQYTQVGNAVPPLLGHAIGKVVIELLNKI